MQYLLLIYSAEDAGPQPGSNEFNQMIGDYQKFTNEVIENKVHLGGEALESVTTATTVRVRNGASEVTDGPFAETKEALGGYYLLDCKDLDEAISYAAKIPSAAYGCVEVRPIMYIPSE